MEESSIDVVLLFHRDNIRYFTGFRINKVASSILVVPREEAPTYVVAKLDLNRAQRDCWINRLVPFPEDTPTYLSALDPVLPGSTRRIGAEHATITLDQAEYVRKLAPTGTSLLDAQPLIDKLRLVKSDAEIDRLRESARIASSVMRKILTSIRPGMIEAEAAAEAEFLLVEEGAEGSCFEPFCMSGENAWLPHRVASRRPLCDGEMGLLDMGGTYDGYCSDITRTFTTHGLTPQQRRLFDAVQRAHREAIDAVRPDVTAESVDAAARDCLRDAGYAENFPHLTGHGIGVSPHEGPIIDEGVETVLQPGMVFTIEPGAYVPGVGAARIEDMVLVTESGCEILTDAPRDVD